MAVPVEEIFGLELLVPEAKNQVIEFLARLPHPVTERRMLYSRWARSVGVPVDPEDLDRVAVLRRGPQFATLP